MEAHHDLATAALQAIGIRPSMRTILIRKGYFVGHKYRFDGGVAVWLVEENAIEIYGDDGELLKTLALGPSQKGSAA